MNADNLAAFARLVQSGRAVFRVRTPAGAVRELNVEEYIRMRVIEHLRQRDNWAELVDVYAAPKPKGTT